MDSFLGELLISTSLEFSFRLQSREDSASSLPGYQPLGTEWIQKRSEVWTSSKQMQCNSIVFQYGAQLSTVPGARQSREPLSPFSQIKLQLPQHGRRTVGKDLGRPLLLKHSLNPFLLVSLIFSTPSRSIGCHLFLSLLGVLQCKANCFMPFSAADLGLLLF